MLFPILDIFLKANAIVVLSTALNLLSTVQHSADRETGVTRGDRIVKTSLVHRVLKC